jgi:hypothetical protein
LLLVIVGSSIATIAALFLDHNVNPTLFTRYDPRDTRKIWVLNTLLS